MAAEHCVENWSSETPYADINLSCEVSSTIPRLVIEKKSEHYLDLTYNADRLVHNTNDNTVTVRSLLATFVDDSGAVIGLCIQDATEVFQAGERKRFFLKCKNHLFPSAGNQ